MRRRFHHRRSPQAPFRSRRATTCLAFGDVFLLLLVTALGSGWAAPARNVESGLEFELHMVDAAGPADPWTKIAGDLNGDGRDELIVGGQQGPLVWYGTPDFKKHTIAEGGWNTVSGAVGDVDGDGDRDVLLGGSIWLENPGNLQSAPDQLWKLHRIADDPTHDIAAADFNGDGRLDAVTRNQSEFGAQSGNKIRVWLQQHGDQWQGVELDCPHGEGLAVADLERDGDPDIVIGGTWFETWSIRCWPRTSTATAGWTLPSPRCTRALTRTKWTSF